MVIKKRRGKLLFKEIGKPCNGLTLLTWLYKFTFFSKENIKGPAFFSMKTGYNDVVKLSAGFGLTAIWKQHVRRNVM